MFTQFKMYVYGIASLVVLGMGLALWYQNGRIDRLKAEVKALQADVETAVAANKTNDATIQELKAERDKAGKSCAKRLADMQALIDNLNKIDTTTGGANGTQASGNTVAAGGAGNSGDALLGLLNGMLPGQGGGQDGVCQAAGPAVSGGAPLVSGDVLYCLDAVNAKNFAKDWTLCQAWANEGVNVIEGMR